MNNAKAYFGILSGLVFLLFIPGTSTAHVKWFCSTADPSLPPLALHAVITPLFGACLLAFALFLSAGTMTDHWLSQRWPALAKTIPATRPFEEKLMRVAVGAFFLCLWDKGAVVPWSQSDGAILTPELVSGAPWINTVQFAIAAALLWRRTCPLAAVGIVIVYAAGVADYGLFHLTDYLFFLGIAGYLALTGPRFPSLERWRVPLLCASLSASLMWTAIEKFLYPQWTVSVLIVHPNITAGLAPQVVTVIAGFVEFTLAFFISAGRGLLRVGAIILLSIFAVAVPEFGHLDAVGHFTIIAILGIVGLHGVSALQERLRPAHSNSALLDAGTTVAIYLGLLTSFMISYYQLQAIQYR